MDLSALSTTLPPGLADAERDMGDKFRAAALSITNLYKSSLGYTKQAYHAGYSACLADVLSTVQSSIGVGQDPTQTLSRLMDWAEARETAMAAFAADEGDESAPPSANPGAAASTSAPVRRAPAIKQHLSHLQTSPRAHSAPLPDRYIPNLSKLDDNEIPSSSSPVGPSNTRPSFASSSSTPMTIPTPAGTTVSTPAMVSSSPLLPSAGNHSHPYKSGPRVSRSPLRGKHDHGNHNNGLTGATFNPVLPVGTPTLPNSGNTGNGGNISIGSKRAMIDTEMVDESMSLSPLGATGVGASAIPPVTPSGRGGRAAKRRNITGVVSVKEDGGDERDRDRDRKRGGRRGHGGSNNSNNSSNGGYGTAPL